MCNTGLFVVNILNYHTTVCLGWLRAYYATCCTGNSSLYKIYGTEICVNVIGKLTLQQIIMMKFSAAVIRYVLILVKYFIETLYSSIANMSTIVKYFIETLSSSITNMSTIEQIITFYLAYALPIRICCANIIGKLWLSCVICELWLSCVICEIELWKNRTARLCGLCVCDIILWGYYFLC